MICAKRERRRRSRSESCVRCTGDLLFLYTIVYKKNSVSRAKTRMRICHRDSKKRNSKRKRNLPYRKITDAESLLLRGLGTPANSVGMNPAEHFAKHVGEKGPHGGKD